MSIKFEKEYWNNRYLTENSGRGSWGPEFDFRRTIFFLLSSEDIKSILDVGCGDISQIGNLLNFFPKAKYYGIDISERIIQRNRERQLAGCTFAVLNNSSFNLKADLVLCLDVLYHIKDDDEYAKMISSLKDSFKKVLLVITHNDEGIKSTDANGLDYIKKRYFDPYFISNNWAKLTIPFENGVKSLYIFKK